VPGENKKIGLFMLVMLCIGSIIGGGIFSLPSDLSRAASPLAILIAWAITGIGILSLTSLFYKISVKKPQLKGGIYSYVRDGFGDFAGYTIGWGYWIASILSMVSGYSIVFSALSYFFPVFAGQHNIAVFIGSSALLLVYFSLALRKARSAALSNSIITITEIILLMVFIVTVAISFRVDLFTYDFWGKIRRDKLGSISEQVGNISLACLWMFVGIEGVVTLSNKAKKMRAVGLASILGAFLILIICATTSLLSLGIMDRQSLNALPTPSGAYVLEHALHGFGAALVNLSIVICVVGCTLNWVLFSIELPLLMARDGLLPEFFKKETKNEVPINSLIVTTTIIQALLLWVYFSGSTYQILYTIVTSSFLIPYICSAICVLKIIRNDQSSKLSKMKEAIAPVISLIYLSCLVYNTKPVYLLSLLVIYMTGIVMYTYTKSKRNVKIFTKWELLAAILLTLGGIAIVALLSFGKILI
jgi:arginine:ornithine antiporter/lysine permease